MEATKTKQGIRYEHSKGQTVFTNQLNDTSYTVSWADYPQEILDRLLEYGIQQKFSDFKVGHFSGKEPLLSKEERLSVMEELDEQLKSGEWKAKKEGGGGISLNPIIAKIKTAGKSDLKTLKMVFADNAKIMVAIEARIVELG